MEQSDVLLYCNLMAEAKSRIVVSGDIIRGKAGFKAPDIDVEIVALQIRKILELIALGSLVSNRAAYSAVRDEIDKFWNARLILQDIERLNSEFYPKPVEHTPYPEPGVRSLIRPATRDALTRDEFLKVYEKCAAYLHARNPYAAPIDTGYYRENFPKWHAKIVGLLDKHTIRLADSPNTYLIHMHEDDGKVHHYTLTPRDAAS